MDRTKRYHLIAIGGSVMHNLAIDLHDMGHRVTGSDDEIYEPSRSRLKERGLLPAATGWDPERITKDIDTIILGKHAKMDNPELQKAIKLGIDILSFPEFIAEKSTAQTRVCIAGSHGKTTTTAMIMHVLRKSGMDFDYLVGAQIPGFEKMVKLSGAGLLVTEGDEYPSSVLDPRAKMLHYRPGIAVITGLAWDHINIYKTYGSYKSAFREFLDSMPTGSICFFDQTDKELLDLMMEGDFNCDKQGYVPFKTNEKGHIIYKEKTYPVSIFGRHNYANLKAAFYVCRRLGIETTTFFSHISYFTGAARRLELIYEGKDMTVYRDFAHAPSKCLATTQAVRERYPGKRIKAVLELHTFSSLDKNFIDGYRGSLDEMDEAYVFYDPHALKLKGMPELDPDDIRKAFDHKNLRVVSRPDELKQILTGNEDVDLLLVMSSGNLGGLDLKALFS